MSKHAVIAITDTLPTDALCERLGVSEHSIRHARFTGLFPASWYGPLVGMCEAAGIDCPMAAFNWKTPEQRPAAEAK